jgi:hypothetical protein
MSDPENRAEKFLQRWSRRKQTADAHRRADRQSPQSAPAEARPSSPAAPSGPDPPAFDPATLPPIDSISAASDIRAFLAPGVPEELTRAALRRAWVTDPAIRDFVGLAENQWDFTKPDEVPGFGSLELTPDLRRMVDRLVGGRTQAPEGTKPEEPVTVTSANPPPLAAPPAVDPDNADPKSSEWRPQPDADNAAAQTECLEAGAAPRVPHRRHGRAMPK